MSYEQQQKQAKSLMRHAWRGVQRLNDLSVWNGLGKLSQNRNGRFWNGLNRTSQVMRTAPAQALGYYGLAGMFVPGLPGSDIINAATMPGWAAANAANQGIRAWRMTDPTQQQAMRDDAQQGARMAGATFMHNAAADPNSLNDANTYLRMLEQAGVNRGGIDNFRNNYHDGRSASGLFTDAKGYFTQRANQEAQQVLNKSASFGKLIGKAGAGIMGLTGLLGLGSTAYDTYDAAAGTPYDRDAVRQTGFDAASAGIANQIDKMPSWQKTIARLDPTLVAGQVEKRIPGSIGAWEQQTGARFSPGILGSLTAPSKPSFVDTDGNYV